MPGFVRSARRCVGLSWAGVITAEIVQGLSFCTSHNFQEYENA